MISTSNSSESSAIATPAKKIAACFTTGTLVVGALLVILWSIPDPAVGARSRPNEPAASTIEQEYVALDPDDVNEIYGIRDSQSYFTSIEGEFEWSQYHVQGWNYKFLHRDEGTADDFVIVPKRDVERRLEAMDAAISLRGTISRNLKTYYNGGNHKDTGGDDNDGEGIYPMGDLSTLQLNAISQSLQKHEYVAFYKKWRGSNHLIVTQQCSIKNKSEPGAYYCVDSKTVCVAVKSMPRFYGKHVTGGKCGTLPLDDDTIASLPEAYQDAYASTCDGNECDGRRHI